MAELTQGETDSLFFVQYNDSGALVDVDPGTLVLTLEDADGVVQSGFPATSFTHLGTGSYAFSFAVTIPVGHYFASWDAELGGVPIRTAREDVIVAAPIAVATPIAAPASGPADLSIVRGTSNTFVFVVSRSGRPVDLTGATIWFTAKRSLADTATVLAKSVGAGLALVDPSAGRVDLTLVPADTRDLDAPLALAWDLEVTEANGSVSTPLIGTLAVVPDVRNQGTGATAAALAYATLEDLNRLLPKLNIDRDRDVLQDCLNRGAAVINARAKRDFWRHPSSGEETWTVDVSDVYASNGSMWIPVPQGLVSVSKVEWAYIAGQPYQEFEAGQILLRPEIPDFEQPYWSLRISTDPLVAGRFWPGTNTLRLTGVRGFATPPSIIRAGNLALAREMIPAAIAAGGAPRGSWENPNALLPTEAYVAVQWAQSLGGGGSWFA